MARGRFEPAVSADECGTLNGRFLELLLRDMAKVHARPLFSAADGRTVS